jgi:hypothetical protein
MVREKSPEHDFAALISAVIVAIVLLQTFVAF